MVKFNYVCSEEFVSASYFDMPPRKLKNEHSILMSNLWGTLQSARTYLITYVYSHQ